MAASVQYDGVGWVENPVPGGVEWEPIAVKIANRPTGSFSVRTLLRTGQQSGGLVFADHCEQAIAEATRRARNGASAHVTVAAGPDGGCSCRRGKQAVVAVVTAAGKVVIGEEVGEVLEDRRP